MRENKDREEKRQRGKKIDREKEERQIVRARKGENERKNNR